MVVGFNTARAGARNSVKLTGRAARSAGVAGRGTRRALTAAVPIVALSMICTTLAGCSPGGSVSAYNQHANKVLAELNAAETALRNFWALPLAEQDGMEKALGDFRKALASCQEQLDSTDSPDPARKLNDLMDQAVGQSRTLADMTTPYADYLAVVAPLAKQASDIVVQLEALDKSQYVPSTITNLLDKARKLDASLKTIGPNTSFQPVTAQFQEFVTLMVKNLTDAQTVLGRSAFAPEDDQGTQDQDTEGSSPQDTVNRQNMRQIASIAKLTDPIIEEWGRLDGQVNAELDQARASAGIKDKAAQVENFIGQAVEQIKELEKQYK
ncbi:MAG: hypothetical protein ACYC99_12665 [Candidatus Geothermincolia bacterium]